MLVAELKFDVLHGRDRAKHENAVNDVIGALVRNGNLHFHALFADGRRSWTVSGLIPARDALQQRNWNEWVSSRMNSLKDAGLQRPELRILGSAQETAAACACARPKAYFLFTTFISVDPPVRCLRCHGAVPLYRLPPVTNGEYWKVLAWHSNYQACDTLQMGCTVGERFATSQMSDIKSSLSQLGLAACAEIKNATGHPAYYYVFRGEGRSPSKELARRCPSCGGPWALKKPLHGKFDFKCDKCHLLSNIAWNMR